MAENTATEDIMAEQMEEEAETYSTVHGYHLYSVVSEHLHWRKTMKVRYAIAVIKKVYVR